MQEQTSLVPYKSLLTEILVKECAIRTSTSKVSELTLFPTEKDLHSPEWLATHGLSRQTSFVNIRELLLFEIDRLLKKETKEAEQRVDSEV